MILLVKQDGHQVASKKCLVLYRTWCPYLMVVLSSGTLNRYRILLEAPHQGMSHQTDDLSVPTEVEPDPVAPDIVEDSARDAEPVVPTTHTRCPTRERRPPDRPFYVSFYIYTVLRMLLGAGHGLL